MEFGKEPNPEELLELANEIKTFSESTDSSEINKIQKQLVIATKLIFLGFAFDKLNMQLISPKKFPGQWNSSCFATTFGFSEYDEQVIRADIHKFFTGVQKVEMANLHCGPFFKEFQKSLGSIWN